MAQFSSYFPVWQNAQNNLEGPGSYCDDYCGTYKSIFLGSKSLLKTQISEKKGNPSSDEKILAYFLSLFRTWQMSVNNL